MNKVICDICGTSYPDTADQCPICGYSRDLNGDNILEETVTPVAEEFVTEPEVEEVQSAVVPEEIPVAPVFDLGEDEIKGEEDIDFNLDDIQLDDEAEEDEEVDYEEDDDENEDDDEDEEEEEDDDRRSNTGLVVILVILIVALLGVMGFVAVRYLLPNMDFGKETEPSATVAPTETEGTVATTELNIPCEGLTMTSEGTVILEEVGANWLINVAPSPENTTDKVLYASSDESVVTVNEAGKVTAVGQGEAVITITCGEQLLQCKVTCFFIEETTAPTATTAPETFPDETTVPSEPEETTAPSVPEETTEPTTAPTEPVETQPSTGEVTLTLNKTDLTFSVVPAYYTLEILEENVDLDQVKWVSTDGNVAICHGGKLQIVGYGTCKITAEYKGVKAECIIRVIAR